MSGRGSQTQNAVFDDPFRRRWAILRRGQPHQLSTQLSGRLTQGLTQIGASEPTRHIGATGNPCQERRAIDQWLAVEIRLRGIRETLPSWRCWKHPAAAKKPPGPTASSTLTGQACRMTCHDPSHIGAAPGGSGTANAFSTNEISV